jgi:hypothetical protein
MGRDVSTFRAVPLLKGSHLTRSWHVAHRAVAVRRVAADQAVEWVDPDATDHLVVRSADHAAHAVRWARGSSGDTGSGTSAWLGNHQPNNSFNEAGFRGHWPR